MNREEQDDLKVKKAWEIAIAPAKTYPSLPRHIIPARCPNIASDVVSVLIVVFP